MPLYPYRCTQCGHRFEKIQKFNDEPPAACPQCGGALERLLTAPGLKFVGTGWYANTPGYGLNAATGVASDPSEKQPESKAPGERKGSHAPGAPASAPAASTTS